MRKNIKTVTKFYDEDLINGWSVNYQYEAENNAAPTQISVTGMKDGKSFSVVKSENNMSVSFGGGADYDGVLIDGVTKEVNKIVNAMSK